MSCLEVAQYTYAYAVAAVGSDEPDHNNSNIINADQHHISTDDEEGDVVGIYAPSAGQRRRPGVFQQRTEQDRTVHHRHAQPRRNALDYSDMTPDVRMDSEIRTDSSPVQYRRQSSSGPERGAYIDTTNPKENLLFSFECRL